jgi:hypothetical protein
MAVVLLKRLRGVSVETERIQVAGVGRVALRPVASDHSVSRHVTVKQHADVEFWTAALHHFFLRAAGDELSVAERSVREVDERTGARALRPIARSFHPLVSDRDFQHAQRKRQVPRGGKRLKRFLIGGWFQSRVGFTAGCFDIDLYFTTLEVETRP